MNDATVTLRGVKFLFLILFFLIINGNILFGEEIHYTYGDQIDKSDCIIPLVKINNNTNSTIQWSELEIRYYFTKDDPNTSYRYCCEETPVEMNLQPHQVKGTIVNISGDEYYLSITFTATSSIWANHLTREIRNKLYLDNTQTINQGNDYSYNPDYSSYTAWNQITLYRNGNLVWGDEPGIINGAEDPTPDPTAVTTEDPTPDPTAVPTAVPTEVPTPDPTAVPTAMPTDTSEVTEAPTATPVPTQEPGQVVTDVYQAEEGTWNDASVDDEHSGYTGSGYVNTGNENNNWIELSVDMPSAVPAELTYFYANGASDRSASLTINDSGTGSFAFSDTEAWDSWNTESITVDLGAGTITIRITATNSSGLPNIDKLVVTYFSGGDVTPTPTNNPSDTPVPTVVPTSDPTATPNGAGENIWIEAESGAAYYPQILKSDSYADYSPGDCASGEIFFEVNGGRNSTGGAPSDGHLVYDFSVSESGDYRVWARIKTPNTGDDSFWVKMDSGSWTKWDNIGPYSEWDWDVAGDYSLSAGSHSITFAYCEDGAKFDKILITNDFVYTPTGFGDPEPAITGGNTYHRSDMVDTHGDLQVIGTNLCNRQGSPIQLKGVNTHGPQWYPIVTNHTIPNLVQTWGIDIIRIAMYIEDFKNGDFWNGYLAHKDDIKQKVIDYVNDAIDAGIYVIIDWHIHNNPSNFTQDAKDFFAEMSRTYGGYAHVLFEIANEPEYTDWSIVKRYAEELIPVIRSNDPDENENIIIVGTPNWSQDVNTAADNPLTGFSNIMYALHFYAASHKQPYRDKVKYALDRNIPIIATEWSACDYAVSYNDFGEADTWVNFLNSNNISFINWSFCNRDDASAILKPGVSIAGPWSSSDLTNAGTWIQQKIKE